MTSTYIEEAQAAFERRFAAGNLSDKELGRLTATRLIEYLDAANGDQASRRTDVQKELLRRARKKAASVACRAAASESS
jgi:hypothetical protein